MLTTIPAEDVQEWAAPLIFNRSDFAVPPGGSLTTSFSCDIDSDWNLIYLLGHMHEWGTSFSIEQLDAGTSTPFYEIPEWDPVYRDAPMIMSAVDAPIALSPGMQFKTTCSWENDTETPLVFPHEMCVSVAFVYPQKATIICDGDGQ